MSVVEAYIALATQFIDGRINAAVFSAQYLEKFKAERESLPDAVFQVLDQLFGDADAFTEDAGLLAAEPRLYLDADRLKQRAVRAVARLTNGG